jgi:hypothetical protein
MTQVWKGSPGTNNLAYCYVGPSLRMMMRLLIERLTIILGSSGIHLGINHLVLKETKREE